MKPPHSGQLSTTDTFLRSGRNDGQTLITKALCSGHYSGHISIVDIIFRPQLILPPRTDLSIADTSNIKHFLQEIYIHFTLGNVLLFRLSFLPSLLFYFLTSLMAFSSPPKCRDCQFVVSVFISMVPVPNMTKA